MSYDELVIKESPNPSITWTPEDYGFQTPLGRTNVWYRKNIELRYMSGDRWLARRKVKNNNGNTELLVKWGMIRIPLDDKEFADVIFSKGLD